MDEDDPIGLALLKIGGAMKKAMYSPSTVRMPAPQANHGISLLARP